MAFFIFLCYSCGRTGTYDRTWLISEGLYIELYKTYSGGALAGDSYDYYLTDSSGYRELVMSKHHDDERVTANSENDTVYVFKIDRHTHDTLSIKKVSINQINGE